MGRLEPVHLEGEAGDRACTASNLLAHFRRGEVVTMRSDRLLPPEVRRLDLHTLSAEHAGARIHRALAPFFAPHYAGKVPREYWPSDVKAMIDRPRPTLAEFIADLRTEDSFIAARE